MSSKKDEILTEQRKDLLMVDVSAIEIEDGFNIRDDMGDLEELANSIQENGVRVALSGRRKTNEAGKTIEGKYILTDGHRRRLAALKVVQRTGTPLRVPFQLEVKGYTDEKRLIDTFLRNDGKPLTVLEQAEGIHRLIVFGYTPDEIAKAIGRHKTYISSLIQLSDAPKKVKSMISSNLITGTLASEVLRTNKTKSTDELVSLLETGLQNAVASGKKTITKRHLNSNPINSASEFKKFLKHIDQTRLDERKRNELVILKEVLENNSMDKEKFEAYFYA